jgi:hypothetical protein
MTPESKPLLTMDAVHPVEKKSWWKRVWNKVGKLVKCGENNLPID